MQMIRNRLLWKLFSFFLLIGLSTLFLITWYGTRSFKDLYIKETAKDLHSRSLLLETLLTDDLIRTNPVRVDSICKAYGEKISSRITVILPEGRVIGDTEADPSLMDNHSDRPEIMEAMKGNVGQSIRHSHTLDTDMLYVAIPVYSDNRIIAVVRTSVALTSLGRTLHEAEKKIIIGGILLAFLTAIASYAISKKISKPLEILRNGANRYARGNLDHKIYINASEELNNLASAMNNMASELNEHIVDVERQRNEKEAVFASMVEGIVAVDPDHKIISINQSAVDLLGIDISKAHGKTIQEVIRNTQLQMLINETLESNQSVEDEITLYKDHALYLQIHGTPLVNKDGEILGALIVLEDITRIKKLENIRREFVANVSHELKTPITVIRGYIETLMEDSNMSRAEMQKFLETAMKNTRGLSAIIDDLLSLSRIEQDFDKGSITLSYGKIQPAIESAIQFCLPKAERKNIKINSSFSPGLEANINSELLERAVINLIDNAINYSGQGDSIEIVTKKLEGEIIIEVRDSGCGIEVEHLPRLFERFYRVDKSRGRGSGGTGLGLSIVKHIAQAHGGFPSVDSVPDEGSIFRIHLPY
jgi:two-component system phosphate regulon sensor histidine kinase PhoR